MKDKLRSLIDEKTWKFLLVGVLNTIVGNGLSFALLNLAGWSVRLSSAVSYVLASVMSYFLNRYFTFKYKGKGWEVVIRFALNIAVCYVLAYEIAQKLISYLLSSAAPIVRDNIAMLTGMCLFVVFNYFGQRFFAFREKEEHND